MRTERFQDRREAGRQLAAELVAYRGERPIVLALPRGGVPVGYEIARALDAPLDVWIVRKIGVPWHPELGVGAIAEGGFVYLSPEVLAQVRLSTDELASATAAQRREVEARVRKFRATREAPALRDRTVILVDDGVATGGTVRAAIEAIRAQHPRRIVLATPVAPPETVVKLEQEVDRVVVLMAPPDLYAIGVWYEDFRQVEDAEVLQLLEQARRAQARSPHEAGLPPGSPR